MLFCVVYDKEWLEVVFGFCVYIVCVEIVLMVGGQIGVFGVVVFECVDQMFVLMDDCSE